MFGFQEPLEQMFLYSITLQNQTPRMINVILSLNIFVVYVTHVKHFNLKRYSIEREVIWKTTIFN